MKRNTKQKQIISEILKDDKSHPSAYDLHEKVKNIDPEIGIATVYRNLNQMAEEGIIKKAKINGLDRYDADLSPHSHLICKKCNSIYDIFDNQLKKVIVDYTAKKTYKITSYDLLFYGVCSACLKKKTISKK